MRTGATVQLNSTDRKRLVVETMNPIAKGLTIHPAYTGGVRAVHAVEHGGQRQKPSALVVILGFPSPKLIDDFKWAFHKIVQPVVWKLY